MHADKSRAIDSIIQNIAAYRNLINQITLHTWVYMRNDACRYTHRVREMFVCGSTKF